MTNVDQVESAVRSLVAVTIIHKYRLRLSFAGFVKNALPFAVMQIALAMVHAVVVLGLLL